MKITKLICVISAAVFLVSCGTAKTNLQEKYREISVFANICLTNDVAGEFYLDENEATHFVDYNSLNDVYLCPKPNCQHTPNNTHIHTEDICSAYDLGEKPCLYGNKLYYMTNDVKASNNGYLQRISMNSCDIDGTNRKSIAELEGYRTCGIMDYLVGDKLYFAAAYEDISENRYIDLDNGSIPYQESGIWCYDFTENKFELIYDKYNGSYNNIGLNGYWQNRLYFGYSEIDEKNNRISGEYVVDLLSGKVSEAESGFVCISEDYLITLENDTLVLHKDDETVIAAEGFEYEQHQSVYIVNDKLFSQKNSYCFDIETGKCRKVSIPKNTEVRAYIDGDYILYGFDFEAQKPIYKKVSESKLIGAEIK